MKHTNFIHAIAPHRQREILSWLKYCIIAAAIIITSITFLQMRQFYQWQKTKRMHKKMSAYKHSFEQVMAENNTLKQEELNLQNRVEQIASWRTNAATPRTYLSTIQSLKQRGMQLESLSIANTALELSARCANEQSALSCTNHLSKLDHVQSLKLTSLRPLNDEHNKGCMFHAKGKINR